MLSSVPHNFLSYGYLQDGLNLAVLLTTLVPAAMVREDDVLWTFETLLRVSFIYVVSLHKVCYD